MAKDKVFTLSADEKVSEQVRKAQKAFGNATNKMQADAKKASSGMGGSFRQMQEHWKGLSVAVGAAVYAAKQFIDVFADQEKAENRLAKAMANANQLTAARLESYREYARQMQKMTTYGDEVIMKEMALLQTFGMNEDQLKRSTTAVLNLSSAMSIDLHAAALLVGKAFAGETGSLSRYGIIIEKGLEGTEKFEAVMGLLEQRFGGSAQADIVTYSGKLEQLYNWYGDIKEMVGRGLIIAFESLAWNMDKIAAGWWKVVQTYVKGLEIITEVMGRIPGRIGEPFRVASEGLKNFGDITKIAIEENLKSADKHLKAISDLQDKNTQGVYKNQAALAAETDALKDSNAEREKTEKLLKKEWEARVKLQDQLADSETKFLNRLLDANVEVTDDILNAWEMYSEDEREMFQEHLLDKQKTLETAEKEMTKTHENALSEQEDATRKYSDTAQGFFNDLFNVAMTGSESMGSFWEATLNKMLNATTSIMAQIASRMTLKFAGGMLSFIPGMEGAAGLGSMLGGGTNPLSLIGAGKTGLSIFDAYKANGFKGAVNAGLGFDVFNTATAPAQVPYTAAGDLMQAAGVYPPGSVASADTLGPVASGGMPVWASHLGATAGVIGGGYGMYKAYQSGSPKSGALSGAAAGYGATTLGAAVMGMQMGTWAGPIGMAVGAIIGSAVGALGKKSAARKLHRVHEAQRYQSLLTEMSFGTEDEPFDLNNFSGIEAFLGSKKAGQGISRFSDSSAIYGIGKYLGVKGEGLNAQLKIVGRSLNDYKDIVNEFGGASTEAALASMGMSEAVFGLDKNVSNLTEEGRATVEMFERLRENAIALQLKDLSAGFQEGTIRITEYNKQLDMLDLGEQETATLKYNEALKLLTDDTMKAYSGELSVALDMMREAKEVMAESTKQAEDMAFAMDILTSGIELTDAQLQTLKDTNSTFNTGLLDIYGAMGLFNQQIVLVEAETRTAANAQEVFSYAAEDLRDVLDDVNAVAIKTNELFKKMGVEVEGVKFEKLIADLYKVSYALDSISDIIGAGSGIADSGKGAVEAFIAGDWLETQSQLLDMTTHLNTLTLAFEAFNAVKLAGLTGWLGQVALIVAGIFGVVNQIQSIWDKWTSTNQNVVSTYSDFQKAQMAQNFTTADAVGLYTQYAGGSNAIANLDHEIEMINFRAELAMKELASVYGDQMPEGWLEIMSTGAKKAIETLRNNLAQPFKDMSAQLIKDIQGINGTGNLTRDINSAKNEFLMMNMEDTDYLSKAQEIRDLVLERYSIEKSELENIISSFSGVADSVHAQLLSMQTSLSNPADIKERMALQMDEINRLQGLAGSATGAERAGYTGQLATAWGGYLELAKDAYQRPSPEYQNIFDQVTSALKDIEQAALFEVSYAEQKLIDLNNDTVSQLQWLNTEMQNVVSQLTGIASDMSSLARTVSDGAVTTTEKDAPVQKNLVININIQDNDFIDNKDGGADQMAATIVAKIKREMEVGVLAEL